MGDQADLDVQLQDGNDVQESYCEIGDLPVAWCGHCKGLKTVDELEDEEWQSSKERKAIEDAFLRSMK